MTTENEELKKTMTLDKERLHTLEAALNELHRKGGSCRYCLPNINLSHLIGYQMNNFSVLTI